MSLIYPCPDHPDCDMEDEGFGFWCPEGEHAVPCDGLTDTDPDAERDRMIDLREAAREF